MKRKGWQSPLINRSLQQAKAKGWTVRWHCPARRPAYFSVTKNGVSYTTHAASEHWLLASALYFTLEKAITNELIAAHEAWKKRQVVYFEPSLLHAP